MDLTPSGPQGAVDYTKTFRMSALSKMSLGDLWLTQSLKWPFVTKKLQIKTTKLWFNLGLFSKYLSFPLFEYN